MAAWKLPLIPLAIAVPTIAAFAFAGPALGVAVGTLAAVAIVVIAARQYPREAILPPPAGDFRRHLLLVVSRPPDERTAAEVAVRAEARSEEGEAEVLVLAPARIGFLDRWASDLEPARRAAQRNLVLTVAALAKEGIAAEARVGDEDLVQAVEDQLRSFPATEVVLVTGTPAEDPGGEAAATELGERLHADFSRLVAS
ncbi:MAG TPA: hypothetical protein VK889_03090 [Solirubrobacterales bacterium]|nr:hypothetical protein [Solirubrobacterales bacterium]